MPIHSTPRALFRSQFHELNHQLPDVRDGDDDAIHDARVIVAPALAVDRTGHRLGQGGGSYDRALARRSPTAHVVALLFDDEVLTAGEVPVDDHDLPVATVVTVSGTVERLAPA